LSSVYALMMTPSKEPSSIFQCSSTKSLARIYIRPDKKPVFTHYLKNHQKSIALSHWRPMCTSLKTWHWEKWPHPLFVCLDLFHFHWVMTISIQAKWQVKRAQWGTSVVWTFFTHGCSMRSHAFWVQIPTSF